MAMLMETAMAPFEMATAIATAMMMGKAMAIVMPSPVGTVAATRKPANTRHPIPDTRHPRSPERKSAWIEVGAVVMDARWRISSVTWLWENVNGD